MKNIDTEKIKELANEKIAYDLFKKEEIRKMNKLKKVGCVLGISAFFLVGMVSVNAATDGAITEGIKNIIKIKINGKENNASCMQKEDGSFVCKFAENAEGDDIEVEVSKEGANYMEMEYNEEADELISKVK